MYKNAVFYFMSGTGNSFRICKEAETTAANKGVSVKVLPIEKGNPRDDYQGGKDTLLGFFFPTHGFTAPWGVITFVLKLPYGNGSKALISACRAGWMIGPWHLPGLEGTATLLVAVMLFLNGYDVRGFTGIDMPSNWLAVHWGMRNDNAAWFITQGVQKIRDFTNTILAGKRKYTGFVFILGGILLAQLSLMYLLLARFMLAKVMYADYRCNGCGICWKNCPFGAIKPIGKNNPTPYWTFACESCERCIAYCPQKAIQTGFLYLVIFSTLMYGVFGSLPLYLLGRIQPHATIMTYAVPSQAFYIAYSLVWSFLGYLILVWSARIKPLNILWTYTTPTKIFRRYHAPGTSLKDLRGE